MNAIEVFCSNGGSIRVSTFRKHSGTEKVQFLADVMIDLQLPDPTMDNRIQKIITVKGTYKRFTESGKSVLDFAHNADFNYPVIQIYSFSRYISTDLVEKMLADTPDTGDNKVDWIAVEFTLVKDGDTFKAKRIERKVSNIDRAEKADEIMSSAASTTVNAAPINVAELDKEKEINS